MISVELCVVGGKHAGQSIPLTKKKFLIGREQDCQLRPNSELVSRHHCIFTVDDFSVRLRDLGSTNGTSVNGERIRKETVLEAGDRVIVGNLEFEIKINAASGATPPPGETTSPPAEDTIVSGSDTLSELPALGGSPESTASDEETFIEAAPTVPAEAPAPAAEAPAAAQPAVPAVPAVDAQQPSSGDTTVIAQPMMMPPQQGYPQQPMYPQQQMGYPQMYGQYPYQGMPGQMPMYPPQGYPQQQPMYPQQPMQPQQEAPAAQPEADSQPEVSLPDPSLTGAREEPKPAPSTDSSGGTEEVKSNQSAAEIIKNQMNRRPGG